MIWKVLLVRASAIKQTFLAGTSYLNTIIICYRNVIVSAFGGII